jgi:hypothetical protein
MKLMTFLRILAAVHNSVYDKNPRVHIKTPDGSLGYLHEVTSTNGDIILTMTFDARDLAKD